MLFSKVIAAALAVMLIVPAAFAKTAPAAKKPVHKTTVGAKVAAKSATKKTSKKTAAKAGTTKKAAKAAKKA